MAVREDLAVVGARLAMVDGTMPPAAVTLAGRDAGVLTMVDHPYWDSFSVSPDAGWVAWVPHRAEFSPREPLVLLADAPGSIRSVRFQGFGTTRLALSSKAGRLALIAEIGDEDHYLIVLDPTTGALEQDVTTLITRFNLRSVERLRISGDGHRIAVGSRESFVVIDLPSRSLVFESQGRFPSLSHRGDTVAFVDRHNTLVITALATGKRTFPISKWWDTPGVGAWSPDGRFLLAGAKGPLAIYWNAAVIDLATGEVVQIVRLEEGIFGQDTAWINRRLLSG